MNPLNATNHCIQFMLDFIPLDNQKETNTFQDYIKRESNYDLSFCQAWINHISVNAIDEPEKLCEFFMSIQETAMDHIKRIGQTSRRENYQSGISVGNSYSASNGLLSDPEGIKELVKQIWFNKKIHKLQFIQRKNRIIFETCIC